MNTYGQKNKSFGAPPIQVWAEVKGVKTSGGTIKGFANLPVGAVIPEGTAVHLDKPGGTLTPVSTFRVSEAATTTKVKVDIANVPNVGDFVVIVPGTLDGTGIGYKVNAIGSAANDSVELTLNAAITAAAGDILVFADKQGEGAKIAAIPNGLLRHDVVKQEGDEWATGGIVDAGRVWSDRIPPVPAIFEKELSTIKFEKGI